MGDIAEAAEHVSKLYDVCVRKKMSIAARTRFEREFNAEIMANKTAEIYEKLLTGNKKKLLIPTMSSFKS